MKWLLIAIFLSSCAQRIKVPINRFLSPEAIGKGAEVEYREVGYSSGVLDFANNNTDNPLLMGKASDTEFYLGLGVAERADIFVRVPEESSSLLGIKVQILGDPAKAAKVGHALAFTLGMGSERDKFNQIFTIDLKSDVTDYSIVHGYRMNPFFMVYEGVSISNYRFAGTVKGATGLNSDDIDYEAKSIFGAHAGIIMGKSNLKLKLEFATQKIEWTHTDAKLYQHFGLSLTAGW